MSRTLTIATAVLVIASSAAVYAAEPANDAIQTDTKISLTAAVATAEKHVQGKAVRAEYEPQKGGGWAYDIEVVAGLKVFDVKVDGDKGTVIASTEDKSDRDDGGDAVD